jgi:hypothetical protein
LPADYLPFFPIYSGLDEMTKIFPADGRRAIEPILVVLALAIFSGCTAATLSLGDPSSAWRAAAAAPERALAEHRRTDRLCAAAVGTSSRNQCAQPAEATGPATVRTAGAGTSTAERAPTIGEAIEAGFAAFDPGYGVTAWVQGAATR